MANAAFLPIIIAIHLGPVSRGIELEDIDRFPVPLWWAEQILLNASSRLQVLTEASETYQHNHEILGELERTRKRMIIWYDVVEFKTHPYSKGTLANLRFLLGREAYEKGELPSILPEEE
jgi:hypothetical protein